MFIGHIAAAQGWALCFERAVPTAQLTRAYYSSQVGKYLPGGIWQPLSQILLVGRDASAIHRTATAYVVSLWSFLMAGATVGGLGLAGFGTSLSPWVRVAAGGCALVALFMLRRSILGVVLDHVPACLRRGATAADLPRQATILGCAALTGIGLVLHGIAYSVLLEAIDPHTFALPVFAFVAAWLIGFLAIPVPSGIGVREAILVACLRRTWPVAPIVAASVAQRLTGIVAELALVAIAHLPNLVARLRSVVTRSAA